MRNTLIVCRRSRISGDYFLCVHHSNRRAKCGKCEIPLFTEPRLAELTLSSGISRAPRDRLTYQPVVCSVCCEDSSTGSCDVRLHPDLFSKLFGYEMKLSGSPILIIGCQSGHIFYSSAFDIGAVDSKGAYEPHPFPIMYSLGQPVQSIHTVYLPENESDSLLYDLPGLSSPRRIPNALVLIGHLGKIVVCTVGDPSQRLPLYTEFHVPGPIISSMLVKNHSLFYSTLSEICVVCLEESCIKRNIAETNREQLVIIPESNFRLPSKVVSLSEGVILLDTLGASSETCELACLSLGGTLSRCKTKTCTHWAIEVDDNKLAGHLKDCIASLEVASSQLVELNKKRDKENNTLTELSRALTTLRDVANDSKSKGSRAGPFQISYFPNYESIGVRFHKPCVDVRIAYSGAMPLSKGWSLLIQNHITEKSVNSTFSQLVPIAGLQLGELTTMVGLEGFGQLNHTISLYLHYDASHLVGATTTSTSVSLPLSEQSFDLIDFLLPSTSKPRQLQWQPLHPISSDKDGEALKLSKDIDISVETATKVMEVYNRQKTAEDICRVFLTTLLVKQELADLISEPEPELSEVTLSSYDGSQLCLQACVDDGVVILSVFASTERVLNEFVKCVGRRVQVHMETQNL